MAIKALAEEGNEQIAGFYRPAVGADRPETFYLGYR